MNIGGVSPQNNTKKTENIAAILEKLNSVVLGQINQNKVQRNTDGTGRTKK